MKQPTRDVLIDVGFAVAFLAVAVVGTFVVIGLFEKSLDAWDQTTELVIEAIERPAE